MDTMETDVSTERTESVSSLIKNANEDSCCKSKSRTPAEEHCGAADVAKARWTLLRQVTVAWNQQTKKPQTLLILV